MMVLGVAYPWSERKGLKDYIALSEMLPDNIFIVLVGLNSEQQKTLPENIIGMNVTQNQDELVSLYNMASIVLNLSYAETFGLTTVEGLACGVPGIVYNCTASPELLSQDTGMIVEPGDIKGVYNAIMLILKNKSNYMNSCRERAVCKFDKQSNFNKYVSLYGNLINNNDNLILE